MRRKSRKSSSAVQTRGSGDGDRSASPPSGLWNGAVLAVAGVYLLLFMEWLFLVTKPSMFLPIAWPERVAILLAAALPASLLAALTAMVLAGLASLLRRTVPTGAATHLPPLVASVFFALTSFLLVENFTKTVFDLNVGSFTSPLRYLYAIGLLLLVFLFSRRLRSVRVGRRAAVGLAALVLASGIAAAIQYQPRLDTDLVTLDAESRRINVLLFSSDGVEAERMSVYGAERETTPFLESQVADFLVSENHFTNAATTAASNGSLLTGKLPTTTGVTQAGDAFRDRHVYQHLPGVLRQLGYHNIEIGLRHNADAHDHNLRRSFHFANSRTLLIAPLPLAGWFADSFPSEQFFLGLIRERIGERVAHAFGAADMQDTFAIVTGKGRRISDELRMKQFIAALERAPRPFFAQVHLMGTHGERFDPRRRLFSRDREQVSNWDPDFLDDSILDFDGYVEEVMRYLRETGDLENTLVVINSDHGQRWATDERLPLLMRFPRAEPRGLLTPNTQRIDIAPTVLSYLGVDPPEWMEGDSILDAATDRLRPILSSGFRRRGPFLPWLSLVQCQKWSGLNLDTGMLEERTIAGHTDPCAETEMLTAEETRDYLLSRLGSSDSLPAPLLLGERLERLRREPDPDERERVTAAILEGLSTGGVARRLDDEVAVARVHWDSWTRGTSSAGVVVRNQRDEPLTRRLVVRAGRDREFPVPVHVEDGETRHDYSLESPSPLEIELPAVPPGAARLFILWSDRSFASGRRRSLGVKLSLSLPETLETLLVGSEPESWHRLALSILDEEVPVRWLDADVAAANLLWDSWTRGAQPTALAVRNSLGRPLSKRLILESGAGRPFPVRVHLAGAETREQREFAAAGRVVVDLPAVAPKSERLFIVWTPQPWTPGNGDQRSLGVKLSVE